MGVGRTERGDGDGGGEVRNIDELHTVLLRENTVILEIVEIELSPRTSLATKFF